MGSAYPPQARLLSASLGGATAGCGGKKVLSPLPSAGPDGFPFVPCVPICPLSDAACPKASWLASIAIAINVTVSGIHMALTSSHIGSNIAKLPELPNRRPFQEFLLRMTAPEPLASCFRTPHPKLRRSANPRCCWRPRRNPPPGGRSPAGARRMPKALRAKTSHPGRDATSRDTAFKLTHRDPRFEQLATL